MKEMEQPDVDAFTENLVDTIVDYLEALRVYKVPMTDEERLATVMKLVTERLEERDVIRTVLAQKNTLFIKR